ncbi:hypothetical protein ACTMU2_33575 [Cupriavidus basilensis]
MPDASTGDNCPNNCAQIDEPVEFCAACRLMSLSLRVAGAVPTTQRR